MAKKTSEAKIRANARYNDKMVVRLNLGFNKKTDADVIQRLEQMSLTEGKQGYIKRLIREDMRKEEGK